LRDPDNVSSATQLRNEVRFDVGQTLNTFYISYRMTADPALTFPHALGPNQGLDVPNMLPYKPFWMGDFANTDTPDQVIPNMNAGGFNVFGNTCFPKSYTPLKTTISYPNNNYFDTSGASTKWSVYQSGDESSTGAHDATFQYGRSDVNGVVTDTYVGDPYNPNGATPTQRFYDGTFIVNGQITQPVSGYTNVQCGQSDFYVATGTNCRARVVASNNAVYASSTITYDIPPDYWINSNSLIAFTPVPWEHSLGYYHVVLGNGTVIQNVTVVDA
jgi:hypothetical protein